MADEANVPNHRYYQPRNNIKLQPNEMSKAVIKASGIAKIDAHIIRTPLFSAGERGVWYDPSDLTTLFQDPAGTTPVTATGQTVALMLDKSKGLVLGPELVTNGTFDSGITGWTSGLNSPVLSWVPSGAMRVSRGATAGFSVTTQSISGLVVGKTYLATAEFSAIASGLSPYIAINSVVSGTNRAVFRATATSHTLEVVTSTGSTGQSFDVDNISVKELAGNHATQATLASRPTYGIVPLGGRRNLPTRTEEFENAVWAKTSATVTANAGTAPDGTTTADLLYPASSGNNRWVYQTYSGASAIYTRTVYAKASGKDFLCIDADGGGTNGAYFNLSTGAVGTVSAGYTASITSAGNGWYRCSVRNNSSATTSFGGVYAVVDADNSRAVTASGTNGVLIWGAQLETGSTATAYQRVTDQYNVTEAGVASAHYLRFDGTDDFMLTNTITPAIDKVQVFAGVRKLSDAAAGLVAEFSINTNTNTGSFAMFAPVTATPSYFWRSYGNGVVGDVTATTYTAPISSVLTGQGAIATDFSTLRINGTQVGSSSVDQGTGNFLAYPLYIGRRGGTTLPFNGQIYSLIVRFGANLTTDTITSTETYVNGKTGAYT